MSLYKIGMSLPLPRKFSGSIKAANQTTGVILLAQNMIASENKLLFGADALRQATLVPNAAIIRDGERIGTCTSVAYSEQNQALYGYYKLEKPHRIKDATHSVGFPEIVTSKIQCLICLKMFKQGDLSCRCIKRSSQLVILDFSIISIQIFSFKNDNKGRDIADSDARDQVLLHHFGGAVSGLEVE